MTLVVQYLVPGESYQQYSSTVMISAPSARRRALRKLFSHAECERRVCNRAVMVIICSSQHVSQVGVRRSDAAVSAIRQPRPNVARHRGVLPRVAATPNLTHDEEAGDCGKEQQWDANEQEHARDDAGNFAGRQRAA